MSRSSEQDGGSSRSSILLVANWDSGVGYAWWLMESFWAKIADHYADHYKIILAYPSISRVSPAISGAPIELVSRAFPGSGVRALLRQCAWLHGERVRVIYLSDRPLSSWHYPIFRLCGVRTIVVHDHTPGFRERPPWWKSVLKKLYRRLPWLTADLAIGATEFVRLRLIQVAGMPPGKVASAPNGIPALGADHASLDVHETFGIPDDRKVLVSSGRAHPYKRIDFVIRLVAKAYHSGRRDLHFLFIGDGDGLKALQALSVELGVQSCCTFAGRRTDVPALLESCDIAIHPSAGEVGYSLSILEYMRAGLPILVPDNPSVCLATYHGRTGLVYLDGDLDSACSALLSLLEDMEGSTVMGQAARRIVAEDFTLEGTHRCLLAALGQVM